MSTNKKTLVIGASTKPERFSNKAVKVLRRNKYDVYAFGMREGEIADIEIQTDFPDESDGIHTVAMYIAAHRQEEFYQKIIDLKPKRVIFNPGTENHEFKKLLKKNKIAFTEFCLLIMLNQGMF